MEQMNKRPDRRKVRNRQALMKGAEILLARKGVDQITIEEITETANLAKGTFYRYFDDKSQIASEVALASRRDLDLEVESAQLGVDDPAARMALGVAVFLRCSVRHPSRASIVSQMFSLWLRPDAGGNETLRRDLESGYRMGRFSSGDLQAAVILTVGGTQAAMRRALTLNDEESVRKLTTELCTLLLRALGVSSSQATIAATKSVTRVFED